MGRSLFALHWPMTLAVTLHSQDSKDYSGSSAPWPDMDASRTLAIQKWFSGSSKIVWTCEWYWYWVWLGCFTPSKGISYLGHTGTMLPRCGFAQASPLYCRTLSVAGWLIPAIFCKYRFGLMTWKYMEIWCLLFICLLIIIIEFEWMNSHLDARWKTNCTVGGVLCRCFSWICDCHILKWPLDNGKQLNLTKLNHQLQVALPAQVWARCNHAGTQRIAWLCWNLGDWTQDSGRSHPQLCWK